MFFFLKTLKILGGWGLCPQTPLFSVSWGLGHQTLGCAPPLCRILGAPLDKPMKFCLPRNFWLASPLSTRNVFPMLCNSGQNSEESSAVVCFHAFHLPGDRLIASHPISRFPAASIKMPVCHALFLFTLVQYIVKLQHYFYLQNSTVH